MSGFVQQLSFVDLIKRYAISRRIEGAMHRVSRLWHAIVGDKVTSPRVAIQRYPGNLTELDGKPELMANDIKCTNAPPMRV